MDMNMHLNTTKDPHIANSNSNSMPMTMPAVFSTSTKITIFFARWTTSSTTQYILILAFLFLLAVFDRFLGALRFQIDRAWSHQDPNTTLTLGEVQKKKRYIPKAKPSPLPTYVHLRGESRAIAQDMEGRLNNSAKHGPIRSGFYLRPLLSWKSGGAWSFQKEGIRALLELFRAFIGYILMLAVMSFNVGVFAAVLLGILCGALTFGRFSRGMAGWQEGGYHNG